MLTRIRNQLHQLETNQGINNEINPRQLAEIEKLMIKKINSVIGDHQNRLAMEFRMS